jgi:renalase
MRIAVVGAGMAGLAFAEAAIRPDVRVYLFDKGRGAGGRMSTRRTLTQLGEVTFDHGAQYFTARDLNFCARVEQWRAAGLVAPWRAACEDAFVGVPTMNAPLKALANELEVRFDTRVDALVQDEAGWRLIGEGLDDTSFDAVIVALPAEQASDLLRPVAPAFAAYATSNPSQPCWTVMAAFDAPLPFKPEVLRAAGAVGWAARNSAKPGRVALGQVGPEAWVIQGSPEWSLTHLEEMADRVAQLLLKAFFTASDVTPRDPIILTAHRWRFARSGTAGMGFLWNPQAGLGVCGDWLVGPRVEGAWLSGNGLGQMVSGNT